MWPGWEMAVSDYLTLTVASLSFVGSHFLMSHPLRATLFGRFGVNGFMAVYSAISLLTFGWMIIAFGRAPKAAGLWPVGDLVWIVASLLTLLAAVLFAGSFIRNPSLPGVPNALAAQTPSGVFKATRHPMMWGFALWGAGHILVAPRIDNFIFSVSLIFLALVGSKAQEIKKRNLMGGQWAKWLRSTHFFFRPVALLRAGIGPWGAGILIWTIATWAHPFWGVSGAGLFRYLGL
jgi:uncharacterized membrane protein